MGYNICIFPDELQHKDINDMCMSNIDVKELIDNNTYSNLLAEIRLAEWRKV